MTLRTGPPDGPLSVEAVDAGTAVQVSLRGEADSTSLDELDAALAAVEVDGRDEVRIDVSGLEFVDVAALRRLALFAVQLREDGHRVTTCGASPMLTHLIRLFGVSDELGLAPPS